MVVGPTGRRGVNVLNRVDTVRKRGQDRVQTRHHNMEATTVWEWDWNQGNASVVQVNRKMFHPSIVDTVHELQENIILH